MTPAHLRGRHILNQHLRPIPLNLQDFPDNEISRVNPDAAYSNVGSVYYVRIMSDPRMLEYRVKWMKAHK